MWQPVMACLSAVDRVSPDRQHFFLFYRKSSEELDMDKVTAAMVLTSLSTSPLVRSPPVRPNGESTVWTLGTFPLDQEQGLSLLAVSFLSINSWYFY